MRSEALFVSCIHVGSRFRSVDQERVAALCASIERIGLRTPITVQVVPEMADGDGVVQTDVPVLVAGLHRLEAVRSLGLDTIEAVVMDGDERSVRLWEIAENLHRADLTVQQRADHIAEWLRLTEESGATCATKPGAGRGSVGGIRAAVRELGIDRTEAQRAVKIASIPASARSAADEAGLTTQAARLEIAKASDPVAKVHEIAERRSKPVPTPKNEIETEDDWRNGMMRLWNRAPDEWRERFIDYVQTPVFDRTRAASG